MILLKDISCLVCDSEHLQYNCSLLTDGSRIRAIGERAVKEAVPGTEILDCRGKTVIPGFVCAHTHLWQILLKGQREDLSLGDWCDQVILPLISRMRSLKEKDPSATEEMAYLWTKAGICELLHSGVTGFMDMDMDVSPSGLLKACREMGIRAGIALEMSDIWYEKNETEKEKTREDAEKAIDLFQGSDDGRVRMILGPSEPNMCSDSLLKWVAETSKRYGLSIQMHIAETGKDADKIRNRAGGAVFPWLENFGLLEQPFSAVHCVHIGEEEFPVMKKHSVTAVYNPKSNMKLGSGIAPVTEMKEAGIHLALGCDGSASNDLLDMSEETRAGLMLQKVKKEDPSVLSASAMFDMATRGGAEAMGSGAGVLAEGAPADLAVLDTDGMHFMETTGQKVNLIVYCAKSADVETVMADGIIRLKDGHVAGTDEKLLKKELTEKAHRYFFS